MKVFIITIGIPASGKTYAVSKCFPDATIISPDNFIGYTEQDPWTFFSARQAWKKSDKLLEEALINNKEMIIFDATFPKAKKRAKYINKAKQYGYELYALYCPIPIKISLARNSERDKFRKVPENMIRNTYEKLQPPNKEEGFDKILTFNMVTNKLNEE